jgi:phosphoribosylanthranilate isomerase
LSLRIKICGLRTPATIAAALDHGADLIGLVFFPPSPRNVSLAEARPLADMARGRAQLVALTVDADDAWLEAIVREVRPDMLQLHGSESPARAGAIRARFGLAIMKAIKVATARDAAEGLAWREAADLILFDARPPQGADRPGGHGQRFDWHALDGVKDKVAYMLSGGLNAGNVADAIRVTGASAVDVSSGVETAPGIKDPSLISAFIAAARAADPATRCASSASP